eukprot:1042789-Prymnesium_polylepis.2
MPIAPPDSLASLRRKAQLWKEDSPPDAKMAPPRRAAFRVNMQSFASTFPASMRSAPPTVATDHSKVQLSRWTTAPHTSSGARKRRPRSVTSGAPSQSAKRCSPSAGVHRMTPGWPVKRTSLAVMLSSKVNVPSAYWPGPIVMSTGRPAVVGDCRSWRVEARLLLDAIVAWT